MKNFLDLRKKEEPKVLVVEKIVTKPRSLWTEGLKMVAVIAIVSSVVWGVSFASNAIQSKNAVQKSFSVIGYVSGVASSTISVKVDGTNSETTYDVSDLNKIETKTYSQLSLADIHEGDRIILQGTVDGDTYVPKRLIQLLSTAIDETATSTATTTLEALALASTTATSTPDTAGSADASATSTTASDTNSLASTTVESTTTTDIASSTDASSTTSVIDTVKDVVNTVVTTVTNTVANVVDTVKDAITPDASSTSPDTTTTAPAPAPTPTTDTTSTQTTSDTSAQTQSSDTSTQPSTDTSVPSTSAGDTTSTQ